MRMDDYSISKMVEKKERPGITHYTQENLVQKMGKFIGFFLKDDYKVDKVNLHDIIIERYKEQ